MSGGGLARHGIEQKYRFVDPVNAVFTSATPGFIVTPPVLVGDDISIVIDPRITGSATLIFPYLDPAGTVVTGFPWSAPKCFVDPTLPPPDLSRIALLMGISDGPNLAGQWTVGGLYYGAAGRVARAVAHDVPAADSAVEAGAIIAEINPCDRSSALVVGAWSPRRTLAKVSSDRLGGTGREAQSIINDEYSLQPHILCQFTSGGFLADPTLQIVVGCRYLAPMAQARLGG